MHRMKGGFSVFPGVSFNWVRDPSSAPALQYAYPDTTEDGKVPLDRPIWPEKEPVDDPVVGSQPIVTSADKGKRVDRSSASSLEVEKTKRERPLDVPTSSSNCFGTDVIEITSSDELSRPPTPARRSTRSKTHSKDRVPHVVTAPQPKVRPRPRKRAKKDDALDIIPDVETLPTPPLPIASGSGAASSTTIDNDSSDDHEITVVFGNVILGGVRMTKEGVYLVPPDSERERNPCRLILNCGSTILWLGTILLPYIFWAHIPNDPNLDVLQQAVSTHPSMPISKLLIRPLVVPLFSLSHIRLSMLSRTGCGSGLHPL